MGSNRRRNGLIAAGIVATVLLGIGLAVFFLVPRTPHITYGDPTYSNLVNTNTFFSINAQVRTLPLTHISLIFHHLSNIVLLSSFHIIHSVPNYNIQVPFTVDNPNYYDLQLKNLDLDIDYNGVFISNFIINNTLTFRKRANTVCLKRWRDRRGVEQ